ncbi:MAG TPA: RagB/SusD family nutrient uptake outer membrane protein [Longimicrobiales bacterium]|nr:RagB/SusD family nutrient uptake outer membrane protein [Longimicrobiales bacterium]
MRTCLHSLTRFGLPLAACSALALGGCDALDRLLSVEAPSRVSASDLENPAAAELLVASVANEFRCTFTHYAVAGGLTGMELAVAVNSPNLIIWDQRIHDTSGYGSQYAQTDCGDDDPALYLPLARTRWLADQVLASLEGWSEADVPDRPDLLAEVAAYAGYAYVLFGESMCSVAFDSGPEEPPSAAFELAVTRFDQSLGAGGSDDQILNLARVGKARALLNLGRAAEAEAVAALVPAGFVFELPYSNLDDETRNKIYELNHQDDELTVGVPYRNMMFAGVADPRVAVTDKGVTGSGTTIPIWAADKFSGPDSPMELASWEEAQLIVAEAAVEDGRLQDAVDIITALHANVGLPGFSSTDAGEIMSQIVYERSAELFLEGQHLQDIKRLGIPLDPPAGTDLPFGGSYGDEMCFELPAIEFLNNPNIG